MRGPRLELYAHLVWGTWDRMPLVKESFAPRMYRLFVQACETLRCSLLAVGGVEDHVHLLVRFPSTVTIAKLVADLKGSSSHLVTHEIAPGQFFKWQGGYGAFTLRQSDLATVERYILNQKEHHAAGTMWDDWEATESPEVDK